MLTFSYFKMADILEYDIIFGIVQYKMIILAYKWAIYNKGLYDICICI